MYGRSSRGLLPHSCSNVFVKAAVEHTDSEACTENVRLPPYVNNVPSVQISAIGFSSATAKRARRSWEQQRNKKTAEISKPTQK